MNKNKGFTMVELLATITILGMLMLIAVPNVISIIDKNKKRTYVEDAQKMRTLAEYEFRSNATIEKPKNGFCIIFRLGSLDMTELQQGPEGGTYSVDQSFVAIANEGGTYKYYVNLKEEYDGGVRGINLTDVDVLNSEGAIRHVTSEMKSYTLQENRSLEKGGTIQDVY